MKNVHEIEVELKGKDWESILDAAFKKKVKEVRVDGFRKGKCPKNIYIQKFGIESLYMDAVDVAAGNAYSVTGLDDLVSGDHIRVVAELEGFLNGVATEIVA